MKFWKLTVIPKTDGAAPAYLVEEASPPRSDPMVDLQWLVLTAQKLTPTPRGSNFQSANVWGPGDFHSCHILPFQPIQWNNYFPPEPANTAKHSPKSISEEGRIWHVWLRKLVSAWVRASFLGAVRSSPWSATRWRRTTSYYYYSLLLLVSKYYSLLLPLITTTISWGILTYHYYYYYYYYY